MVMSMSTKVERCPLCKAPMATAFSPFCSQGCKDRDLLNWLGEGYAIAATHGAEEDDNGLDSIGLDREAKPSL
jgi:uncharacterized protein